MPDQKATFPDQKATLPDQRFPRISHGAEPIRSFQIEQFGRGTAVAIATISFVHASGNYTTHMLNIWNYGIGVLVAKEKCTSENSVL